MNKYKVGDRVIILFGCPHFDYHSPNRETDLMPDLVGRMGIVTTVSKGFYRGGTFAQSAYQLDLPGIELWFGENRLRSLTRWEKFRLWWK